MFSIQMYASPYVLQEVFLLGMLASEGSYSLYVRALYIHLCFQIA